MTSLDKFGKTASGLSKSPLGIIALFIVLIYGVAALVLGFTGNSLEPNQRWPLVWFLVLFPVIVLAVFTWLVSRHPTKLYSPADFRDETHFLQAIGMDIVGHGVEKEIEHRFKEKPPKSIEEAKSVARDVAVSSLTIYEMLRKISLTENQRDLLRELVTPAGTKRVISMDELKMRYSKDDIEYLMQQGLITETKQGPMIVHDLIAQYILKAFPRTVDAM